MVNLVIGISILVIGISIMTVIASVVGRTVTSTERTT